MFRKLLKYDIRAVLKYWWIAAASSVVFALIAGVCINIVKVDYTAYQAVYTLGVLGLILSIVGMTLLPVLTVVLVLVRLYKHFFTDEGYLTFTLPVKKSQLLNSKIVMAFLFNVVSTLLLMFDVALMLAVGLPEEVFDVNTWRFLFERINELFQNLGVGFVGVVGLEILVLVVIASLFTTLAMFACLTVAAVITRKHKLLAAIGLYYGGNWVLSGVMQLLMLNSNFFSVFDKLEMLSLSMQKLSAIVILLILIGFSAMMCAALYLLQSGMLYKKLNLE